MEVSDGDERLEREGNLMPLSTLRAGVDSAYRRFQVAYKQRNSADLSIATFDVLNWMVCIDDRLKKTRTSQWFGRSSNGALILGLRCARNRVHHQWADAFRYQDGAAFPIRFPTGFHEWVWRELSELPKPQKKYERPKQDAAYRERLEGTPARGTLLKAVHLVRAFGAEAQ